MNITNYAIKNYQFTLIMVLMVAVLGASSLLNMPRAEDPEMHAPLYPVTVIYPGTSPEDMEELVVKPLEQRIYSLDGIKKIKTTISDGLAVLLVEFEYKSDVDGKHQELTREVNSMRERLPQDIYRLDIDKFAPSDVNILQMELVSENASTDNLRKYAKDLKEDLEKVTDLKGVEVQGISDRIIRVDLNMSQMARMKIPLDGVSKAIESELVKIPGGQVFEGDKSFNIKTDGNLSSVEDISNIIIAGSKSGNIQLKDIAEVYTDYAPATHIVRLNGFRAVTIVSALKEGKNITQSQEEYLTKIEEFKKTLPENIDLILHFDQAENVNQRLSGLGIDFSIAIFLVLLTLLPLGNRASVVVMLAIPLSLAIGIVVLDFFDFSLNQLSIVGFVVSLGLLVDDSIVVVENIERWMREGHNRLDAVKKATAQITKAVLGCTATLVIAFLPLVFLPEESGDFIRSLPISIIATVLGSMIVALTVVPFFSTKILKPTKSKDGNVVLQALQKGIHKTYAPLLERGLKYPWMTLIIAILIFGGSLLLIPVIGISLFPSSEKPQFLINVNAPLQSNIYYTDSVVRNLEKELKEIPQVNFFTSNVGKGNPQTFYNVSQRNESGDFAQIFVQLHPDIKAKEKKDIIDDLRTRWRYFEGSKIEIKDFEQGMPMEAPVEVRVLGDNLDTLRNIAAEIEKEIELTEGSLYVGNKIKNLKSDIRVRIDKAKAQSLGVPTANIGRAVRTAIAGLSVGSFSDPDEDDDDYDIRLTVPRSAYTDLSVFKDIYVDAIDGNSIPITQVADFELESSPVSIDRLNKVRMATVTSFVQKGYLNNDLTDKVIATMDQFEMPDGYHYEMGGEVEGREESFGGFGSVILVAAFMFIAVLILQFGTLKSTVIVLSVIPLGVVGAVVALLIAGESLSFVATIGLIALAGIEVKNTILLVDFTNELRMKGVPLVEAIESASEARFLPIVLTTLTAIGGLTPIAMSSNPLISPLAIVMIGGLISSTLLSRVVTPVVYELIPPRVEVKEEYQEES